MVIAITFRNFFLFLTRKCVRRWLHQLIYEIIWLLMVVLGQGSWYLGAFYLFSVACNFLCWHVDMIYWQCLFKYAGILLVFTATNANYPVLVLQVCFPPVLDAIEDSSQLRIRHYEEARTVTAFTILFLLQCFVVDLTGS